MCTCILLSVETGFADKVELRDGTVIEGSILAENPDSIEIEVGSNEQGTIHRILRIHASEISSWSSDSPRTAGADDSEGMIPVSGVEHVERMLRDAEALMQARRLDEGIAAFGQAADASVGNLDALEPDEKAKALKMRAHALRLQLAAMEGKVAVLENQTEGVQDELKKRAEALKREDARLASDFANFNQGSQSGGVDLRSRQAHNELVSRQEALERRRHLLTREQDSIGTRVREIEAERVRTLTQMDLVEERVDRAEDDARTAERRIRRR
ncbi:MAG: hypothetical protein PF795_10595 [Kiritimatiellae bacterium]|nr:hypothetical protein [Kiritimatiellia bacterium]